MSKIPKNYIRRVPAPPSTPPKKRRLEHVTVKEEVDEGTSIGLTKTDVDLDRHLTPEDTLGRLGDGGWRTDNGGWRTEGTGQDSWLDPLHPRAAGPSYAAHLPSSYPATTRHHLSVLPADTPSSTSPLSLPRVEPKGSPLLAPSLSPSLSPRSDAQSPSFRCEWAGCDAAHVTFNDLVNHVNDDHVYARGDKDAPYVCQWRDCPRRGKGFNARYKMLIHVRVHTQEKPHVCRLCSKSFSRVENLKIHVRTHTGEKPYACPYRDCAKAYSNSSDRIKHIRTHQTHKPFLCKSPGCAKSYTDPSSLRKHCRLHNHWTRTSPLQKEDYLCCEDPRTSMSVSPPSLAEAPSSGQFAELLGGGLGGVGAPGLHPALVRPTPIHLLDSLASNASLVAAFGSTPSLPAIFRGPTPVGGFGLFRPLTNASYLPEIGGRGVCGDAVVSQRSPILFSPTVLSSSL